MGTVLSFCEHVARKDPDFLSKVYNRMLRVEEENKRRLLEDERILKEARAWERAKELENGYDE